MRVSSTLLWKNTELSPAAWHLDQSAAAQLYPEVRKGSGNQRETETPRASQAFSLTENGVTCGRVLLRQEGCSEDRLGDGFLGVSSGNYGSDKRWGLEASGVHTRMILLRSCLPLTFSFSYATNPSIPFQRGSSLKCCVIHVRCM